jgi:hypothetical protein
MPMKTSPRTRAALVLALLLLAATASQAIVIFFKDGSDEIIAESYRIEGDHVIAILRSGQETAIRLDAIDLEKTKAMEKVARGSAIVIDRVPGEEPTAPVGEKKTVSDLFRERSTLATPAAAASGAPRSLRRTAAGNPDFLSSPRQALGGGARAQTIESLLERHGLADATPYQGTQANRVLIDIVTASRGDVFAALESCAAVLLELRASAPEVQALELAMATATRSRAGQFVLTPEQAERLRSGAVTPAEHFVANVLF